MIDPIVAQITAITYGSCLVAGVVRAHIHSKPVASQDPPSWEFVVRRLKCVRASELARLANLAEVEVLHEATTGSDMLEAIGGLEGVRRLQHNGLILAALAQRIDFVMHEEPDAVRTISNSALKLRRKALIICTMRSLGCGKRILRPYLKEIATLYCRMVSQLIGLYAVTHRSRVQRLVDACNL